MFTGRVRADADAVRRAAPPARGRGDAGVLGGADRIPSIATSRSSTSLQAGCSKGLALREWAARRGIAAGEVMAMGDNLNDLEMLEFAGRPVIMGNALEELQGARLGGDGHQRRRGRCPGDRDVRLRRSVQRKSMALIRGMRLAAIGARPRPARARCGGRRGAGAGQEEEAQRLERLAGGAGADLGAPRPARARPRADAGQPPRRPRPAGDLEVPDRRRHRQAAAPSC